MTLGQAKAMAMKLMDEYMVDTPPTDDEETLAKLNSMFQAAQIFVCTIKPLEKYFIIEHPQSDTIFNEYDLPKDFYQAFLVRDAQGNGYGQVEFHEPKLMITDQTAQTIRVDYYAYPTEITDDTPDDYEFELTQDAQQVLPYAVVSDLLKTDPSAYYTAFEVKFNNLVASLSPASYAGISFVGGIRI